MNRMSLGNIRFPRAFFLKNLDNYREIVIIEFINE